MSHHDKPLTLLGDLTPADFLANYWQQKPKRKGKKKERKKEQKEELGRREKE